MSFDGVISTDAKWPSGYSSQWVRRGSGIGCDRVDNRQMSAGLLQRESNGKPPGQAPGRFLCVR